MAVSASHFLNNDSKEDGHNLNSWTGTFFILTIKDNISLPLQQPRNSTTLQERNKNWNWAGHRTWLLVHHQAPSIEIALSWSSELAWKRWDKLYVTLLIAQGNTAHSFIAESIQNKQFVVILNHSKNCPHNNDLGPAKTQLVAVWKFPRSLMIN